jgi:hypothetical protein
VSRRKVPCHLAALVVHYRTILGRFGSKLTVLFFAAAACSGPSQVTSPAKVLSQRSQVEPAAAEPVSFFVDGNRVGSAVVLQITGVGRGLLEGEPFENPDNWSISCSVAGRPLQRVVNGSARLERLPVGPPSANRWDVTVQYTVGFALPGSVPDVKVDIAAPGAQRFEGQVALEVARLGRR